MTAINLLPSSILIATTDKSLSTSLGIALEKTGAGLIVTEDGHEAVRFSREEQDIRIMVLDTNLPGLNGYEATRLIRKTGNPEIAIILLAWFSVQALEMAYTVGCNELVSKPVNENELMEVVMKLQHD